MFARAQIRREAWRSSRGFTRSEDEHFSRCPRQFVPLNQQLKNHDALNVSDGVIDEFRTRT